MKISYAIPACNEHYELEKLLSFLIENKRAEDEIIVQLDSKNYTKEVYEVTKKFSEKIKCIQFSLDGDFSSFKNNLKKNCSGDWIFQIDADEYLKTHLIENLHLILEANPSVEVFYLARINTVDGITQKHIKDWNWKVNENGWINFPDLQTRILRNRPNINWINKVHEVLTGHTTYAFFPTEEEYCILHHKTIDRQEKQNAFYNLL